MSLLSEPQDRGLAQQQSASEFLRATVVADDDASKSFHLAGGNEGYVSKPWPIVAVVQPKAKFREDARAGHSAHNPTLA